MDLTAEFDYTGNSEYGSLSTETEHSLVAHQDDLIGFLGLMNHFGVPLLPITWQPGLAALGRGGTAEVKQAPVHAGMSFAFKRMRTEKSFERWVIEVMALTRLRGQPNVSNVEACCLEILDDGKLSPVLVFQMAELGDLEKYMRSAPAKDMELQESLHLCLDVGSGLKAIHEANVVHCDLKPANILVYRDTTGKARAKVADFGHATIGCSEDTLVYFPTSMFWNAPDHHSRAFHLGEAKKFDAFSYGLIVYWLLVGRLVQDEERSIIEDMIQNTFRYDVPVKYVFSSDAADNPDEVTRYAEMTIPARFDLWELVTKAGMKLHGLSEADKASALRFFHLTLADKHQDRSVDWDHLLSLLDGLGTVDHMTTFQSSENDLTRNSAPVLQSLGDVSRENAHPRFNLRDHIRSLAASDPYVRNQLVLGLKKSSETWNCADCQKHNAFQVALFAFIGFGQSDHTIDFQVELDKSGFTRMDLEEEIHRIRTTDSEPNAYNPYAQPNTALSLDYLPRVDWTQNYQNMGPADSKSLTRVHLAEILSCGKVLGTSHSVTIGLTRELASILKAQSRFLEATEILKQALRSIEEEIVSMTIRMDLIVLYRKQGHFQVAEREASAIYTALEQALGFEDGFTLITAYTLAGIWRDLKKLQEAERLSAKVAAVRSAKFGREHPTTMKALSLLAAVYSDQKRFTEAENLQKEILDVRERTLGYEHEFTWTTRSNLAAIYTNLNKLEETAAIERLVVSFRHAFYGPKHDLTLDALSNLAITYRGQKKFDQEKKLLKTVVEGRVEVLGSDNPNTLISVQALATNFLTQKLPEKAEPLLRKMVEARSSRGDFGPAHPSTLASRNSLALACFDQSKIGEAITMQRNTIKEGTEKLGASHWAVLRCKKHLEWMLKTSGDPQGAKDL